MTLAFGIEYIIHEIRFENISDSVFPSLTIIFKSDPPITLLPYSIEVHNGQKWTVEKSYRNIILVDAFKSVKTYPFTFEMISPVESTALGNCTYELQPLLCDAMAAHGSSNIARQTSSLKDFSGKEVAQMDFEMRVVFFNTIENIPATQITNVRPLSKTAARHMATQDLNTQGSLSYVHAFSHTCLNDLQNTESKRHNIRIHDDDFGKTTSQIYPFPMN